MSATETERVATEATTTEVTQEEEGFRVYVGNLAYSTTEEQLREFLVQAGGEILNVTLPTRFKRPGGYAFVGYETEDQANKVVEELNDKELNERKVQLNLARSKEESASRRAAADERRKAAKAAKRETATVTATTEGEATEGGEAAAKPKKKKSTKKREPRRRLPEDGEETTGETPAEGEEGESKPKRQPRERKPREARIDEAGATEGEKAERKPRERKPRMELTGEVSKTTIFVANLPFSVDDEALASLFTNLSIKVKSAHVVKGLRKGGPGRKPFKASKGFGFVEVEDPAQQQEAVDKAEGTLIGDRKITAKVANEMKPVEVEAAVEAETTAA